MSTSVFTISSQRPAYTGKIVFVFSYKYTNLAMLGRKAYIGDSKIFQQEKAATEDWTKDPICFPWCLPYGANLVLLVRLRLLRSLKIHGLLTLSPKSIGLQT